MNIVEKINKILKTQKLINILKSQKTFNFNVDNELNKFSRDIWVDEIVYEYGIQIISKCSSIPNGLLGNSLLLKIYMDNFFNNGKKLEFINSFKSYAWTEEIVIKYGNKILSKMAIIPKGLTDNSRFLNIYIKNFFVHGENIDLIDFFDCNTWPDQIIKNYGELILKKTKTIPKGLVNNSLFLKIYMQTFFVYGINIDLIDLFTNHAWSDEIVSCYWLLIINKINRIPNGLLKNHLINKEVITYVINNDRYDLMNFFFHYSNFDSKDKKNICLCYKYLLSKNCELLSTLIPEFLTCNLKLSYNEILRITKEKQLEQIILNMNAIEKSVFSKIMCFLRKDSDKLDVLPIVYNVIKNIGSYADFIDKISIDDMTDEQINNFVMILQSSEKMFEINKLEDLNNKNLDNMNKIYFNTIEQKIKKGKISLDELKKAILIKRYALAYNKVKFIYERYCSEVNIKQIKSSFDNNKNLLLEIYSIFKCNDKKKLISFFENSNTITIDYKTSIYLESSIRAMYAKKYSETLYKLNEKDLFNFNLLEINEFNENELIEQKNRILSLKKLGIDVYILERDFKMQIHSLKSYSYRGKIDNYLDDWNQPNIANHGVSTTYISNNQIAPANIKFPVLGFDSIKDNELLLSSPYDLESINTSFASSMEQPSMFLNPMDMINNTRHFHNEMVRERITYDNGECHKTMPSYIVYIVDDIKNKYSFMSLEEYNSQHENNHVHKNDVMYFEEVKRCARQMNIPIVVIDRLSYAKKEIIKCNKLLNNFNENLDLTSLSDMFLTIFNNMVGSQNYNFKKESEASMLFSEDTFIIYFNSVLSYINNLSCLTCQKIPEDILFKDLIKIKIQCIQYFIEILNLEIEKELNSKYKCLSIKSLDYCISILKTRNKELMADISAHNKQKRRHI